MWAGSLNAADDQGRLRPGAVEAAAALLRRAYNSGYCLLRRALGTGVKWGLGAALVACGLGGSVAWAAATNDTCAGAEVIPSAGPFPYLTSVQSIIGTSTNGDSVLASCNDWVANSLWYRFTPATTAVYTISSCADAPTATTVEDTVMAIYTSTNGCAGPFVEVPQLCGVEGCADDVCGYLRLQAALTVLLNAGTTYYIVVWRFGEDTDEIAPETADVQLLISQPSQMPNETCQTALPLSLNIPVTSATWGARNDYQVGPDACFTNLFDEPATAAGPDVVFAFRAPAQGRYSFKVWDYSTASYNDLVIYLLGTCPTGQPPVAVSACLGAANRSPASSAEEIPCVALASNQIVYLVVDDAACSPGSKFTVCVTPCLQEAETNNTPAAANLFGCAITGMVVPTGDVDFYRLGAPPTGSRLFVLLDGEAADLTDFDLRVTTSTRVLEYDDDNNDKSFGYRSPNMAGTPLPGGTVFLRIDHKGVASGPYRLYAAIQPPLSWAQREQEPNDTPAQVLSNPMANLGGYFYGTLDPLKPLPDVDYYPFNAQAGDIILVSLDGDPLRDNTPLDAQLQLLDSNGNVLVFVDDPAHLSQTNSIPNDLTATQPFSPAEGLVYRVPTASLLWVRVSAGRWADPTQAVGDYLLNITRNCPLVWNAQVQLQAMQRLDQPGRWKLSGRGGPHLSYLIQQTTDLRVWSDLGLVQASADGQFGVEVEVAPGSCRFYRAMLRP